ncbi:MAG TPA: hypothetical protein VKB50_07785 [Vicinamibacterales bacterium]|nr:hypothetical protein [Vicinamibacterales bacterium]
MSTHSLMSRAASILPFVGIVLALANWGLRPQAASGWVTAIAVLLLMVLAELGSRRAFRQSTEKADARRRHATACESRTFNGCPAGLWALCGLAIVVSWLALPVDVASPVSTTVTAASVVSTLVLLARLRQRRPTHSSL